MTTIVAFLATAGSRIMPISTFGIFAATIVFVNYCLALTLYPSAIVLWERNVRPCEASCAKALCGSYCDATTEDGASTDNSADGKAEEGGPQSSDMQLPEGKDNSATVSPRSAAEIHVQSPASAVGRGKSMGLARHEDDDKETGKVSDRQGNAADAEDDAASHPDSNAILALGV